MKFLAQVARAEAWIIVLLLMIAVGYQLVIGRIRLGGIFLNKKTGAFDPGRVQLLLSTLVIAGSMLIRLAVMRAHHALELPASDLLYVAGGSHGIYLFRKYMQSRTVKGG